MHHKRVHAKALMPVLARYRLTYNLFRRRNEGDLFCAVPEDVPVPNFIETGEWEFRGKTCGSEDPSGFDATQAKVSARFNGFHLFVALPNKVQDQPTRLAA
jgi:hypothetical protein